MAVERTRILIISLDGATFSVLGPLMDQGYLPNLGRLRKQGLAAELESVVPPVTAPAWTSFMTGKHPGKHGIFDFTRFNPNDYSWAINNAQHIRNCLAVFGRKVRHALNIMDMRDQRGVEYAQANCGSAVARLRIVNADWQAFGPGGGGRSNRRLE